ncbi:MAG: hypothetical protein P4L31_07680 [Candidatus Babeliales bacterium]|nr:hypothetical protein [Candidatus Babeliales bacterium]
MKGLTADEIFTLLINVDCIQDVQNIAEYIHENKDSYNALDNLLFQQQLMMYVNIFVK